jgi:hypothetical protein
MVSIRAGLGLAAVLSLTLAPADAMAAEKKVKLRGSQAVAPHLLVKPDVLKGLVPPDLVIVMIQPAPNPVEGLADQGYCRNSPAGGASRWVTFGVGNNGGVQAPETTARVTFDNGATADMQIAGLQPGHVQGYEVNIPDGCYPPTYHGSCSFTIVADAQNVAVEANEANNDVDSLCLLPGT